MAQSACNLISRFVIRPCFFFMYIRDILISLAAGSRSTNSVHLAILRTWVIILSCIQILMVILTDGFPVSHSTMNNAFAAAFFKMGLLGQAHNNNVSNIWCFVKFYPRHLPRLAQLIDCSFVIPSPPSLNDIIQFPPGQFLADVQQSVSSPSRCSFSLLLQPLTQMT